MVIGYILSAIGMIGTVFMGNYISNDSRYTYSPPFTDHETMVLVVFLPA